MMKQISILRGTAFCVLLHISFFFVTNVEVAHGFTMNAPIGQAAYSKRSNKHRGGSSLDMMDTAGLPEVAMNAWDSYNIALQEQPLLTKSITAGVILGAADLSGQKLESYMKPNENDEDESSGIDVARVIRFAIFGLVLQAPWNHFYYLLLDGALPPTPEPFTTTTGIKVIIDQFIQAPIFTVLIFFFLGILEGKSVQSIKEQLNNDYKDTMIANWKLWVPATVVNIAFCPPVLRVLYLNCVFYFWSIFLSLKLNSSESLAVETQEETTSIL